MICGSARSTRRTAAGGRRRCRRPPTIRRRRRCDSASVPLLHLAGRVALPESLCLGPGDARVRLVPSPGAGLAGAHGARRSLVFVGFRPTDPDLVWLSSWLATRPREACRTSCFWTSSADPDAGHGGVGVGAAHRLRGDPLPGGNRRGRRAAGDDRGVDRGAAAAVSRPTSTSASGWISWAQDPGNPQPREVLARVEAALREDERWDRLVELLLRRLDLQENEDEQLAALREVARIFRERLGAPRRARSRPGSRCCGCARRTTSCGSSLRADAGAANGWEELVAQASEIAQAAGPTPEAARIWRELARVLREKLGRPDDALAAYREALVGRSRRSRDARRGGGSAARARALAGAGAALRATSSEADDPARAVAHMLEAAELHETQLADAARRDHGVRDRCWRSIPTRTAASRRARSSACTRARSAGPIWRRCWSGARCSRAPPRRRPRCGAGAPSILADDLDSLDDAAEELESAVRRQPGVADRELLDAAGARSTSAPNATTTTCARCSGRRTPIAESGRAARDPAPAGRRGRGAPRRAGSGGRGAGADPAHRAARRRRVRRAASASTAARIGRRRSPRRWQRRLEVTETIEAQRELLSALAETYERELDEWEPALDAYTRGRGGRRPRGRRPTPPSTVWRSGWDAGTWPPRRRASGPRRRRRTRARWRRWRASAGTAASFERALAPVPRRRRSTRPTGTAQAALLTEAAIVRAARHGNA